MGKVLVIKGADFSANKVEQIAIGHYLDKNVSGLGFTYMGSANTYENWGIKEGTNTWYKGRVIIVDVHSYIGKQISIYCTADVLENAIGNIERGRIAFVSDLGGKTVNEIISKTASTTVAVTCVPTLVSLVQKSPVTAEDNHTYTDTVPSGAKYLIISHNDNYVVSYENVKIKVID